jgi:Tat protein secretion system quality control protein TatD with DNase activity
MNILNLCNAISLFWEFSVCSHYFSIEVQRMLCTGRYWAWCRRKFPTLQSIHLHCFNGDPVTVKLWLDSYPGTYFGFSSMVKGFGDRQGRGLKTVPGNRLLLESDSPPHLPNVAGSVIHPAHLFRVAEEVARVRDQPPLEVLRAGLANGRTLYRRK